MDNRQAALRQFGYRLREQRLRLDMSLERLSTVTGIGEAELLSIEAGDSDPTILTVFHIAKALNLSPSELVSAE